MKRKGSSFWPSYVDIMTTLFSIMLVLFAVTYVQFKHKEGQLKLLLNEYQDIINVYSRVDSIDSSPYFAYDSIYLKHALTIDITYQEREYDIKSKLLQDSINPVQADRVRRRIAAAGDTVQKVINDLERELRRPKGKESGKNIKFLVVIEGQSSRIPFYVNEWKNNETLSFLRAEYLKKFWTEDCGLFRTTSANDIDSKVEIIVAGSGEGGVPRNYYSDGPDPVTTDPKKAKYPSYWKALHKPDFDIWRSVEMNNQRFLINIIPIIGNIKVTKEQIETIER